MASYRYLFNRFNDISSQLFCANNMDYRRKNVTLNDIAAALGVSKATVSLAINNDPRVAESTRRKVLAKVDSLGYVYNRGAAGLSTGRSNTIGLAVHDITNPYFAEVCKECESLLSEHRKLAFLASTRESLDHQHNFIRALIEHRGDGLIMSPANGTSLKTLQPVFASNLPTVLIARDVENAGLDFVGNDDIFAFRTITTHLLKLGHTRIAMIGGGQQASVSLDRRSGFLQAMAEAGLGVDPSLLIPCATNPQAGEEVLEKLLNHPLQPTAAVAFTDHVAIGLLSGMHRKGLSPGKDLALVSCDDIEEADRGYAQLTSMRTCKGEIGRTAAEFLLRRINDPEQPLQHLRLQGKLIVRKSCGAVTP